MIGYGFMVGVLSGMLSRAFVRGQEAPVKVPAESDVPHGPSGSNTPKVPAVTSVRSGSAGGLLLKAIKEDRHLPIQWIQVPVGRLVVTMARDAVSAKVGPSTLRLPVSFSDTVAACKLLGCIAPTKEICDAAYELSSKDGRLIFRGLVRNENDAANMTSLDFTEKFNGDIERQLRANPHGGMIAGPWKYWILHPRIVEKGAVNYGGWNSEGSPIQTVGGRHDATHFDYSQLLQPVQREARLDGRPIDLLDHFVSLGLPKQYVEVFR